MELSNYKFLEDIYQQSLNKKISNNIKKINSKNLEELNSNGYTIIKSCLDLDLIENIKNEFNENIKNLTNIVYPRNVKEAQIINEKIIVERISQKDLELGENHFRNISDKIQLKDPLKNSKRIFEVVFNKELISLATNYFEQVPYITYCKIEKNYSNNLKDFDTQLFHFDENAYKLLKVFVYLEDVTEPDHGPFTYVKGSHKNIEKFWNQKISASVEGRASRWTDDKIVETFGQDSIVPILAKKGDIVVANTIAFHKGTKPKTKDRYIIIFNFGLHKDYIGYKPDVTPAISRKFFDSISDINQKKILTLLEKD
jgi:ectoine hydroxylase-related dioxygenase (phytanoyl-CoA dioxygenase family)